VSGKADKLFPMVDKEQITPNLESVLSVIAAARMERRQAGQWVLILDVLGDVPIDSDRLAGFNSEVRITGKQKGSRPRHKKTATNKAGKFKASRKH